MKKYDLSHITLVYIDSNGKEYHQPAKHLNYTGIPIEPEISEPMELNHIIIND